MAESKEKMVSAKILAYETAHLAIATIGGKTFRVKIPSNSNHPAVGDCELKDKWPRREFPKEEQTAIEDKKKSAKDSDSKDK